MIENLFYSIEPEKHIHLSLNTNDVSGMARRYSRSEKGKWQAPPEIPAKRPPVRIPANDDSEDLIEANRLTIIGRLTNPIIITK
ncbi:hypothetical protein Bca52824_014069 [Brassica carinata]|uniref:Uncharacterized protein n=1 Tax=Brassica carinata TaxID=52824 RepID=A0A8X7VZP4_BRACI|nr:hypothetical protein Bca52824_014069 [Brassica carinata]